MNNNSPLNTQNTISNDQSETKTQTPIKKIIKKIKKYYSIVKAKLSLQFNRVGYFQQEQHSDLVQVQQQVDNPQPIQNQNASILAQNQLPQKVKLYFSLSMKQQEYVQLQSELRLKMDDEIFSVMKAHESFNENGVMLIPLSFYQSCVQSLKSNHPDYDFEEEEELTQYLINLESIPVPKGETIQCYSINKNTFNQLKPYQQQCVTKGIEFNGKILIAMQAGFGKTFSSLALADVYRHAWPLLIICPPFLREHWSNEIKKWLNIPVANIQIIEGCQEEISNKSIIIISYNLCIPLKEKLQAKQFKIFIYDEAQNLNKKNKNTEACQAIFQQATQRIFLSDLTLTDQFTDFINEQQLLGCYEPAKDIQNYFPKLTRHLIQIPHYFESLDREQTKFQKKQQILDVVRTLLERGSEKIVFFAFQQDILYAVREQCDQMNVKSILINCSKKIKNRNEYINLFQKEQNYRIAIVSYTCGGIGISLTAASTVIFGELYYQPEQIMIQAEGRVYRLQQEQDVNCYYLIGNTDVERNKFIDMKQKYFGQAVYILEDLKNFNLHNPRSQYEYQNSPAHSLKKFLKLNNQGGRQVSQLPIEVQQRQQWENEGNLKKSLIKNQKCLMKKEILGQQQFLI